MKHLQNYFDNVTYLLGSVFINASGLFAEESIVNKDFMEKFNDVEDKKKLNEVVKQMRDNNIQQKSIILKNNERVTILVK